ncbi:hypothetical protein [Eubacterium sp. AB3007]|uniref:hypothetical protein n=1 Tax=Eubacterium sp. AB3007 TaxID=1392487 RepID=UPI00048933EA|nr:hypothetical protein [Eubacterium sp. AB3007]
MCLIITTFAAIISTIVWYAKAPDFTYKLGTLALMFWGASLMWLGDAIFCVAEGEGFFDLSVDDALLGIVIVMIGLMGWLVVLLANDPKGVMSRLVSRKTSTKA